MISAGLPGQLRAVDVARAGEVDRELVLDPPRVRREEHHAVAQADGLAHVVGDEEDRLPALRPDPLEVAVELLAGHGVERAEGLVHEEHAGVRGEGSGRAPPAASCRRRARGCRRGGTAPARRAAGRTPPPRAGSSRSRFGFSFRPNSTFPSTSSQGKSADSWNMTIRSRPGPTTGLPSARTLPRSGRSSPATMLSSVDFPQPLGPTRQTNSPSLTSRSIAVERVDEAALPERKDFVTRSSGELVRRDVLDLLLDAAHGRSTRRSSGIASARNPTSWAAVTKRSKTSRVESAVKRSRGQQSRSEVLRDLLAGDRLDLRSSRGLGPRRGAPRSSG